MRDVFIIVIEHSDQLSDVLDALPFDDAEFRELASKRVRNSRPLVDEQLPGCIPGQRRLLLLALYANKPHVRPRRGFADRVASCASDFPPLEVGFHVVRRNQAHPMAQATDLTAPIVR